MLVLLSLLSSTALAERPVTYREALESALENNPALQRAALQRDSAEGSLIGANGVYDPTYNLSGFYNTSTERQFLGPVLLDYNSTSWGLTNALSQTLPTGTTLRLSHNVTSLDFESPDPLTGASDVQSYFTGNLSASITQNLLRGLSFRYNLENVTLSRQGLETAELALEKSRQDTMAQTAQAYWNFVYQSKLRDIQREAVLVSEEALRVGSLKTEAGELAPVEKTRLEAALVQAQANAIDAENQAEEAANTLLLAMGEDPGQAVLPATTVGNVNPMELDPAQAIEVALAQNLDLAMSRTSVEQAELQRKNANHNRLPTLSATVDIGRRVQDGTTASDAATSVFGSSADPSSGVSANLSVPFMNRAARGQARSLTASAAQRRSELDEQKRQVAAQVEQQVRTLQSARRRVELADANAQLAEQTLKAEEALADAGRAIQKDVLEARTEVERTLAEAAKARTDYKLAQVELLRLQGQLSPDAP